MTGRSSKIDRASGEIYLYQSEILFYIFAADSLADLIELKEKWESGEFNPTCPTSKLNIGR